jgi:hypothetical protein
MGVLIAGTSGLCSAGFVATVLYVMIQGGPAAVGTLPLVVIVGGIPFGIGFGMFKWGKSLIGSADREDQPVPPET